MRCKFSRSDCASNSLSIRSVHRNCKPWYRLCLWITTCPVQHGIDTLQGPTSSGHCVFCLHPSTSLHTHTLIVDILVKLTRLIFCSFWYISVVWVNLLILSKMFNQTLNSREIVRRKMFYTAIIKHDKNTAVCTYFKIEF